MSMGTRERSFLFNSQRLTIKLWRFRNHESSKLHIFRKSYLFIFVLHVELIGDLNTLNLQGNRMNSSRARAPQSAIPVFQQSEEDGRSFSDVGSTVSSKLRPYDYQVTSHVTDTTSLNSGQASEYEDVESGTIISLFPSLNSNSRPILYLYIAN